jgi:hypothetical protein
MYPPGVADSAKPGTEPRVKGVAFRTIDLCFSELRGAEARARSHLLMHGDVGRAYRDGLLLAASWYAISWYRDAFRAFRAATGEGLELPRSIGKRAVMHDMRGVHKQLLAKIVSPQMLLEIGQRVFHTYYDTGRLEVLESRKGYARVRLTGCLGWDANMWSELCGSCEGQLEIAGARHIRMRVLSGGGDADTDAEFEARWV